MTQKQNITPETKVGPLLDAHPELEAVLLEISPAFKKLLNPLLRKTVAKVASLRQVAKTGSIPVGELVNKLRAEVGLKETAFSGITESTDVLVRPAWKEGAEPKDTLDARSMLEEGGHPIGSVIESTKDFESGDVFLLIVPFIPIPLLERMEGKGFEAYSESKGAEEWHIWIRKQ